MSTATSPTVVNVDEPSTIGTPALATTADVTIEASKPSTASIGSSGPNKTASYRQLHLVTSRRYQQVVIGVLLFFAFVDTLGTVLFLPAGGILCQLAEGGPMEGYAELMYAPNTTDFKALGEAQASALGPTMCLYQDASITNALAAPKTHLH